MSIKKNLLLVLAVLFLSLLPSNALSQKAEKEPLTVAESSSFTATSRYADVIAFIQRLQEQSPLIRVETLGVSTEGRKIPLLVIGNPLPSSASGLSRSHRAAVYIQANIHAGEVEGKEASLMLARDILQAKPVPYLDNLVILIAPIFNSDGNEKISPDNRRNQAGPEKGVGIRYNGQNLDLNRDSMKLESPELRGMVRNVLMRWDPVLLVDCHTTNGSPHQEPVTYSWPLNPNGSTLIIDYMRDQMMPSINRNLKDTYSTLSIPYGNFMDFREPEKGWRNFGHQPRYVTNYVGLRNRLSILNENYSNADYKTRVLGCYHFLSSILDYCSAHKDEIVNLVTKADLRTVQKAATDAQFAVEFEVNPLQEKITILGWEMEVTPREQGRLRIQKSDREKTYILPYYSDYEPKRSVQFPYAYLMPFPDEQVLDKLRQHGIIIERLSDAATLEVETFQPEEVK
jgi:dipeptidyl-peptidase-4